MPAAMVYPRRILVHVLCVRGTAVIVIGAGIAGLAAAESLARAGRRVTLLEARHRVGGRMHTILGHGGTVPIEIGAEFIHGERVCTWQDIQAANLPTQRVPDRRWCFAHGKLAEEPAFYNELQSVLGRLGTDGPDQDLESFLEHTPGLSASGKVLARDYVEGFHAAPADRMSIRGLARAEAASEQDGEDQFRLADGYSTLVQKFSQHLWSLGVELWLETVVRGIRWAAGDVEVLAQTSHGAHAFRASQAVVTLPLGVLQARGPEGVVFEPALVSKEEAIRGLGMGAVMKLTLQFRERFWPVENFGFIHAEGAPLGTWWSDQRGPILTGWAGGPRAERLARGGREALVAEAVDCLARFFQVDAAQVRGLLVGAFTHDWLGDPFARGAYSFPPVGMADMPGVLAAPVEGTLFFAGEATDTSGDLGTVHGALASGRRAAREALAERPAQIAVARG